MNPMPPTMIPVLMVIQRGPISDRRYRCLISYQPSNDHMGKYLTIAVISLIISGDVFFNLKNIKIKFPRTQNY